MWIVEENLTTKFDVFFLRFTKLHVFEFKTQFILELSYVRHWMQIISLSKAIFNITAWVLLSSTDNMKY